jgi:hypothetical protein
MVMASLVPVMDRDRKIRVLQHLLAERRRSELAAIISAFDLLSLNRNLGLGHLEGINKSQKSNGLLVVQ